MPPTATTVTKTRVLKVGAGHPSQVSTTLHFVASSVRAWGCLTGYWPHLLDEPPPPVSAAMITAYLLPNFVGDEEAFVEGDDVTGVLFILTGGIAHALGTVEGVRLATFPPPVGGGRPLTASAGVVLYDVTDGHVVHAHSAHTLAGGRVPRPEELEAEAFAAAQRVGALPARAATLHVAADRLASLAAHRVDPVSRRLTDDRSVTPRDRDARTT